MSYSREVGRRHTEARLSYAASVNYPRAELTLLKIRTWHDRY